MIKFKYETNEERENIISQNVAQGFIKIEEHNITEGNFLIFVTKEERQPQPTQEDYMLDLDYRLSMIELGL